MDGGSSLRLPGRAGKVSAAGAPPDCGPARGRVAGIGGGLAAGQARMERQQRLNPLPCGCRVGHRLRGARGPPAARLRCGGCAGGGRDSP